MFKIMLVCGLLFSLNCNFKQTPTAPVATNFLEDLYNSNLPDEAKDRAAALYLRKIIARHMSPQIQHEPELDVGRKQPGDDDEPTYGDDDAPTDPDPLPPDEDPLQACSSMGPPECTPIDKELSRCIDVCDRRFFHFHSRTEGFTICATSWGQLYECNGYGAWPPGPRMEAKPH